MSNVTPREQELLTLIQRLRVNGEDIKPAVSELIRVRQLLKCERKQAN